MGDIANVDQAEAWDGEEGAYWADHHDQFDRALAAYREPMRERAAVVDSEHVLDVGCGNGQTTRDAGAATPSGSATGVDLSGPMLAQARAAAAAEGLTNVEFVQADAQVHPFEPGRFDLVMSRFGVMFFADKVAAFSNLARALRPGGRLFFVVWQGVECNHHFATMTRSLAAGRELPTPPPGASSPFGLADPDLGRRWLAESGFVDIAHESVERPFWMGSDPDDALAFAQGQIFARMLLADLDADERAAALDRLHTAFTAAATPDGVLFDSATWFLTARVPG